VHGVEETAECRESSCFCADPLAALLLEITKRNASAKRRLKLELTEEEGPGDVAREIRRRLSTITRSRSIIGWQGRNAFAAALDIQRSAIVERVGARPATGFDLIWRMVPMNVAMTAQAGFKECRRLTPLKPLAFSRRSTRLRPTLTPSLISSA